MKRPMVWVCLLCIFFFCVYRCFYGEEDDRRYYIYGDALASSGQDARVEGRVDRLEKKTNSYYLYLADISVSMNQNGQEPSITHLSKLLICFREEPAVLPGNRIQADGTLQDFDAATNPGQFDSRSYYRDKNIYYQMFAEEYRIVSGKTDRYKEILWNLNKKLKSVAMQCLPEKEAGIVITMLLGDKSALDVSVKELYQQNGIGHLLAISGLHVSILCMAFYQMLLFLRLPRQAAAAFSVFLLYSYGALTGFSISANRAIIMMVLYLLAGVLGRSYDLLSAMAFSALLILLQKPFALTSCSFLLSYAAMAGIGLIYPLLQKCVYGDEKMRRKQKRKLHRMEREWKAQGIIGYCKWWGLQGVQSLKQSLLMSMAIQLGTLPAMLYFYYEVPVYGVLLNMMVLPLASVLVILAAIALLSGLICLPLAEFLSGAVVLILNFYEILCSLFWKLPLPVALIGRPECWRIIIYVLLLFGSILLPSFLRKLAGKRIGGQLTARWNFSSVPNAGACFSGRYVPLYLWTLAAVILIFPPVNPAFAVSFLDVGQGDGIVMHCHDGTTFLIDGGSSSEKKVGEYRIEPYLKYHGIGKIDYMIMTHADADHISGQMELLEQSGKVGGIQVGQLLIPQPARKYQEEEGYQKLLTLAESVRIPVQYIHTGDTLQLPQLKICCLHPDAGFEGNSANAYSTTLDIRCRSFRMLLCGDLEGAGEEAVLERLRRDESFALHPLSVLKVAHHGSKNSTSEELLQILKPQISVISCGKNNRYGHPHPELTGRLDAVGTKVWRTDEAGAVMITLQ